MPKKISLFEYYNSTFKGTFDLEPILFLLQKAKRIFLKNVEKLQIKNMYESALTRQ